MRRPSSFAFAFAFALAGCGASQFVVHVDTDAPVPPRPGSAADPARPLWLFDALRVDVLRNGSVIGDSRDFALDEGLFQDRRVSFGIAPDFGDHDLTLRLRMFRGDHTRQGDPWPNATVEADLVLPALLNGGGPIDLKATLHVDDVGQPVYAAAEHGTTGRSLVGSWPGAQITPCAAPAGDGEVCVPGGAFWMGDPLLIGADPSSAADQERLVIVSPFYLRTRELTVAELRGLTNAYNDYNEWDPSAGPDEYDAWCNYTDGPSADDPTDSHAKLPLNCITWDDAHGFCQHAGGDLPSEAQLEFVTSGRGEERVFVWGGDTPACADAVWGWGGLGTQTTGDAQDCRDSTQLRGALPAGNGLRDRVTLGDPSAEMLDLAGNLSEFVLDQWSRQDEAYWSRAGIFTDPVADLVSPADGAQRALRGGNFHDSPLNLRAAARRSIDVGGGRVFMEVGIRCARPGR